MSLTADSPVGGGPLDTLVSQDGRAPDGAALISPGWALINNHHLPLLTRAGWPRTHTRAADGGLVEAMAAHIASCAEPLHVAATAAEIDDNLLFAMLDVYQSFAESDRPFASAPQVGLIIGRDSEVLGRNLRKVLEPASPPAARTEIALFTPNQPEHRVATLSLPCGEDSTFEIREVGLRVDALEACYARPIAAAAIATHGYDSCADGGDGAVLCGLRQDAGQPPAGAPGYLACGHGSACPRGPRPLKLSGFGANIFMVAACNGLRARDSVLANDFNLALEFAEGPGEGYVSTVFGAQGNIYAATMFLAAMASGHGMCSATMLANLLLACGGLERAVYLPVGRLDAALTKQPPAVLDLRGDSARSVRIDAKAHCIELRVDDPAWLDLHALGRLGLQTEQRTPTPLFWFARSVRADPGGSEYLEIFLGGFPQPLDGVTIAPWDLGAVLDEVGAAPRELSRWVELGRLNDPEMGEAWDAASNQLEHCRRELFGSVRMAAYSVTDQSLVNRLLGNLRETALLVRGAVADEIVRQLPNTFWLSNVLAEAYRIEGYEDARCPACSGIAMDRSLRNIASGECRRIILCARCGIVSDTRAEGPIKAVRFIAPLVGQRGGRMSAELEVSLEQGVCPAALDVQVRLSTLGQLTGEPISQVLLPAEEGLARYRLVFELPADLRPHRFFIKAFVSTASDFAFASHVFFAS